MQGRVLIVDDDQSMCDLIETDLTRRGIDADSCTAGEEALVRLRNDSFDVVLTDLNMPGLSGIELCSRIVEGYPDVPVVVITAFGSLETAVAAIRAGAYDFVTKPIELELLWVTLRRAIHHRSLEQRVRVLDEEAARASGFEELVGESPPMRNLYRILGRIADTETSVLVGGETGTGKELVARSLHRGSRRRDGPFVAVNCAAIPPSLMESELFGHVRGAFTDASSSRAGLLVQANGGTLFLDEIGDLPIALQPKLLRVLEEGRVRAIGSDREIAMNARVIAATHQDLQSAVDEGRFRDDLYYRINVITVDLPPLRARGTDILLLAQRALAEFATRLDRPVTRISSSVADKLLAYPWPGNVRELRNAVERAVALATYEEITVEDLPERIRAYEAKGLVLGGNDPRELASLDTIDRRYIEHVLKTVGGNRTEAARILGLDRKTLYRKLLQYERTEKSEDDDTSDEPDDPR